VRKLFRSPLGLSVVVGLCLPVAVADAQMQGADSLAQRSTAHAIPVPSATAARKDGVIRIDGHIDEAAWAKATPLSKMTQIDPEEGKPATQRSDIRFLYDDEALYVSARLYDTAGPARIAPCHRRQSSLLRPVRVRRPDRNIVLNHGGHGEHRGEVRLEVVLALSSSGPARHLSSSLSGISSVFSVISVVNRP